MYIHVIHIHRLYAEIERANKKLIQIWFIPNKQWTQRADSSKCRTKYEDFHEFSVCEDSIRILCEENDPYMMPIRLALLQLHVLIRMT